ncbi:hypothetical protein D3C86_1968100 [compost metagenome]
MIEEFCGDAVLFFSPTVGDIAGHENSTGMPIRELSDLGSGVFDKTCLNVVIHDDLTTLLLAEVDIRKMDEDCRH